MTDPNGAARYMLTWIPSRLTPVMLALIYQHRHGSVMGMVKIGNPPIFLKTNIKTSENHQTLAGGAKLPTSLIWSYGADDTGGYGVWLWSLE